MTTTAKHSLSLEEFLCLPETEPASEYIDGEVIQKPMPSFAHSQLQFYLMTILRQYLSTTRRGLTGLEVRCVFGPAREERPYVPDVVFVAREKITANDLRAIPVFRQAPDLAIEILSPDQPAARFADKLLFYLANGVRLVWVVDPDAETIHVFAPGESSRVLRAGDSLDGGAVLPGFALLVSELFAQLRLE